MTNPDDGPSPGRVLDQPLLDRIHQRAAGYDRDNAFFTEDFTELVEAGYLTALVPASFGGGGLTLRQLAREQSRLAAVAPATALAVNMHHVWVGVAKALHDRGDDSLDFVLTEAAAGEVFGFGISEGGNDLVLFGSRTRAVPDGQGGYSFHGHKIFGSLAPAWTRLGTMGLDTTSGDAPKLVYGFITREGGGVEVLDDWDAMGMRASQSCSTVLDGAHAPADRVVRRLEPGPNADLLIFGIFSTFEILLASVYAGIGDRALQLAIESAHRRTSMKNDGAPLAHDPDLRRRVAAAGIAQDGVRPQIDALAHDVDTLVDHGPMWFAKLSAMKVRATETAREVVDQAIRTAGGSSYFSGNELGRLYRDVLAGIFHPSDDESAHSTMATALLGPVPER